MTVPIALPFQPWQEYKAESEKWEAEMKRRGAKHVMGYGVKAARARWEAKQKELVVVKGKLAVIWIDKEFVKANPL